MVRASGENVKYIGRCSNEIEDVSKCTSKYVKTTLRSPRIF